MQPKLLIDGNRSVAGHGGTVATENSSDGSGIAQVAEATADDVDKAARRALPN